MLRERSGGEKAREEKVVRENELGRKRWGRIVQFSKFVSKALVIDPQ